MEDTKSLLVMVLQKIFHDRPQVIDQVYKLIYDFNSGLKEKGQYEKTLKAICELVKTEIPSEILVYLLTLVDVPQSSTDSPLIEKMQKTHNVLPEWVRPHLLDCLNSFGKRKTVTTKTCPPKVPEKFEEVDPKRFPRPKCSAKPAKGNNRSAPVKRLLDITAFFVIKNEQKLKHMYNKKRNEAWKLIYSNCYKGDDLKQCYNFVDDLNRKSKVIRMIEDDNITEDIFFEEYRNSDVYIKEKHMEEILNRDPFEMTKEVRDKMLQCVNKK